MFLRRHTEIEAKEESPPTPVRHLPAPNTCCSLTEELSERYPHRSGHQCMPRGRYRGILITHVIVWETVREAVGAVSVERLCPRVERTTAWVKAVHQVRARR